MNHRTWTLVGALCVLLPSCGDDGSSADPGMEIAATKISFIPIPVGAVGNEAVLVRSTGADPLTVEAIEVSGDASFGADLGEDTLPLEIAPGDEWQFLATYTPSSAAIVDGVVTVRSDAGEHTIAVEVSATANLFVAPNPIDLGTASVGSSYAQTMQVRSVGAAPLEVRSVAVSGEALTLEGLPGFPVTLGTQELIMFDLVFAPVAEGDYSGTLTIESNDAGTPTTMVSISGAARP